MRVFHGLDQFQPVMKPVVTVGTFDGVHIGHRRILDRLNQHAGERGGESLLLTFWPHPRMVLQPDNNELRLLNTLDEKINLLEKAGLQNLVVLEFTRDFSRTSALEFVRDILHNTLKADMLVIGYDHHFGKNREGSFEQLEELAPLYDFDLEEIPAQEIDEVAVSSTKIRRALTDGNVEQAHEFLHYPYFIHGKVVQGDQRGRQLGYPTANVQVEEWYKLIPADGVYAVTAVVEGEEFQGMLSNGSNPTFPGKGRSLEVNLFDFNRDIYGKEVQVNFHQRLREERKFKNEQELKQQMAKDEEGAKRFFNG